MGALPPPHHVQLVLVGQASHALPRRSALPLITGILNKRQLALALFDQRIHTSPSADTAAVYAQTMAEIGGVAPQNGTKGAARFGHMVGYDAKYYGAPPSWGTVHV